MERHKNVPSSYLILIRDNHVLLQRRFNTGYEDGNYGLVAGHVEKDESFTHAMIREAREEAGIQISPENIRVIHVMHRNCGPEHQRVDIFFAADEWDGEIRNMEPQKCDDLSWFPVDDMPTNIIPYIRQAIERVRSGEHYSEYGW